MVQDTPEGIAMLASGIRDRGLDRLTDGDSQAARSIRHFRKDIPSGLGLLTGAGDAVSAPDLHHEFAKGLLIEADSNHEYFAFESQEVAGEGERAAPLSGAGLGRNLLDAHMLVVPNLGNGRVRLVASGRTHAFVFVIDAGRGLQVTLQVNGSPERGGTPPGEGGEYLP